MNSVTDMVSQRTNLDGLTNLIVCRCASHVSLLRSSIVIRVLSVLRLLSAAAMPKRPETVASPTPRELSPRLPPLKISHAVEMPAPCESDAKILARTHAVHSETEIRDNIMALNGVVDDDYSDISDSEDSEGNKVPMAAPYRPPTPPDVSDNERATQKPLVLTKVEFRTMWILYGSFKLAYPSGWIKINGIFALGMLGMLGVLQTRHSHAVDRVGTSDFSPDPSRKAVHDVVLETLVEEIEGTGYEGHVCLRSARITMLRRLDRWLVHACV